jgi:hypothetical protein
MRFNPHSLIRLISKSLAVFFIEGFALAGYRAAQRQIDARGGNGFHHLLCVSTLHRPELPMAI